MNKIFPVFLAVIMALSLAACSRPASASELKSDKPRVTSPAVSQADLSALVDGNTDFAFDLYQKLRATDGNLFYSPYSLSLALAMTYAGSAGDTRTAMANAVRFTLPQEKLHPAFNSLDQELASRGEGAKGKDQQPFRLHVVNAIWGQKDFSFLPGFLDVLAENYGAGLRILDFIQNPEQSRVTINDWVSEQTEQKIKDLIPQGAINSLTRLVLTNAIYFNAAWQYPFDEKATSTGNFNLLNGNKVSVPMMHQTEQFNYFAGDNYQAVELPYDGHELSMVIMMPNQGKFDQFESSLTGQRSKDIIQEMKSKEVILSLPKFEYDSSFGLKKPLTDLGMGIAFTENADFSGMDGKRDLLIQDVLHKAFVSVDEAGTEAAAASAVIVGTTSMPETVTMNIDRPFIFLIRDIQTGAILFLGRVVNPASK